MKRTRPITVAELTIFTQDAAKCMSDMEKREFIDYIAHNPEAGKLVRGTGGVRKVRWAIGSRGKSGGARIIYYYHDESIPLFLITAFTKSNKGALEMSEKNEMKKLTRLLAEAYRDKSGI